LPLPPGGGVTVTDTPVTRETDYGRVDQHSSAIRAPGDARHTYNRVPDYPVPGAEPVAGAWTGGRITVSSSSSDSTAMPDVAPATSPAAAIDGDSATAWVSNSLQAAVGQWMRIDFDHPVTNAAITLTPSATAVGAQVRRILIETATGSTTLRFDEPGKPLAAALPYGETPWVRITAAGTDDGSAGVQFGITDLTITQYDASGFAHQVDLRHTVRVPGPPPGAPIAGWDLGSELLGRPGCAPAPDTVRCAPSMALTPEEPVNFSRTLTVPAPVLVTPTVWVRPRQGPKLAALIAEPNATVAQGDSDAVDVLGSAYAGTDGDPATAWTAPQRVVQHKTPPTLTLRLPRPTEVTGLRLVPSRAALPVRPTMVAVNLGDGPQVAAVKADSGGAQTLALKPRVTDTVTLSLLDWDDVIDRNALGFDQLKPPGLAEVAALGADGNAIAPADAARNRGREISLGCDRGPVIAVAGRFVHTAIHTTVGAILDDQPLAAVPCDRDPIALPAGDQELLISPGAQFVVDGAQLSTSRAPESARAERLSSWRAWGPARREVQAPPSATPRVMVIPESINPGWVARTGSGARLTPIAVNGWQQGWVVPAGDPGTITLTFASNPLYGAGLVVGLALLPLLALLAFWRTRTRDAGAPTQPWRPGAWAAVPALAAGALIAGAGGVVVMGAALGLRYALRARRWERLALVGSAGGLIVAGAALSRQPWRSADGYAGHSANVQLLALVSLAVLTASVIVMPDRERRPGDE
ncbi:DUF3367 domain-containing protein, partial [Mycobacterium intracellulare]